MPNQRVADHKWHDIQYQDLPDWVKRRIKDLNRHGLKGKTFLYRRDRRTGRYQRKLRYQIEVKSSKDLPRQATHAMSKYDQDYDQDKVAGTPVVEESLGGTEIPPDTIIPSFSLELFGEKGLTKLDRLLDKRIMSLTTIWTAVWFLLAAWLYIKAHEVGRNFYLYSSLIAGFIGVIGLALLVIRLLLNRRIENERIEQEKAEIIDMIDNAIEVQGGDEK